MEKLLTVKEAAEILGLHQETVRSLTREGRIRTIKPTGRRAVRISMPDLQEFVDSCRKRESEGNVTAHQKLILAKKR